MAYRLGYEIAYTGASGAPFSLGDTFDFTQLSMLSDGMGQTYGAGYIADGSVNDPNPTENNFTTSDTFFLNGGTIGATGTGYNVNPTEFDTFDVNVKFYAPLAAGADANGMITALVRLVHFQLVNPLDSNDIREFVLVANVYQEQFFFHNYPPVSATVATNSLNTLTTWSTNRILDDQNFTMQQPGVPAICFAKGTKIETISGYRKIEELKEGDLLRTLDGGWQPIRWVGARSVVGRGKFAPIVIEAGALGNTEPLVVSKQHRLLMRNRVCDLYFGSPEALVAAHYLCNGSTIREVDVPQIDYYHILLDAHDLIKAEGLWAETLLLSKTSYHGVSDAGRDELRAIFPDLLDRLGAQFACRQVLNKAEARLACMAE